jgi:hypothetical protein
MSVLACNRKDCRNIMCDRYNTHYGYICDECFEELIGRDPHEIQLFMWSSKIDGSNTRSREQYEQRFPLRD